MEKVSATIITLNEEANIRGLLETLDWVDEIIVSDSGSTDRTVDICRDFGATVFTDDWLGFGGQKNLCAERASNLWVLNLDADERVTPELKESIGRALKDPLSGYRMARKNYFGGRWIRYCGWYPDYHLRLYRKDHGAFNEREVHEGVRVRGPVGTLKGDILHYSYRDISDYLLRMDRYSTLAASQMYKEGRRASAIDILFRPKVMFLKMYVLKLGFLEGDFGLILSSLYSSYTTAKYIKLKELESSPDESPEVEP